MQIRSCPRNCTFVLYFHELNVSTLEIQETLSYPIPNALGKMAHDTNEIIYLLTSTGWHEYQDAVAKLNLNDPHVNLAWFEGSGMYGIGFDPNLREIYLANANGFQGNGTIKILDEAGIEQLEIEAGRGPSGFLFR